MRMTTAEDAPQLLVVYREAQEHAQRVGAIDWPSPIPPSFVNELIATNRLFCFENDQGVVAALKLSRDRDERIWHDAEPSLYLGKIVTAESVRGRDFFAQHMLPEISLYARNDQIPATKLRLDCLADTKSLKKFYVRIGFHSLDDVTFFSEKQKTDITVTPFEMTL